MPNQRFAALRQTHRRVSRGLWQWCSSKGALLVLLLLLALALALSYLFPQTPAHIRLDPITYKEWLSAIQIRYKSWTPFLEAIGIFYIRNTTWFHILLALLAFVLVVSLGEQIDRLVRPVQTKLPTGFYDAPGTLVFTGPLSTAEAAACAQRAIEVLALRVYAETDQGKTYLYGHRARWAAIDGLVTYLGAMFIVVGLAINGRWGWQQSGVRLLPGEPVLLGPGASHRIELLDAQTPFDSAAIEVNKQRRISIKRDFGTHQSGFSYQLTDQSGPLVRVQAQHANGSALLLSDYTVRPQPTSSLQFAFPRAVSQDQTDRLFIVPDEKLVVRIKWLNQSIPVGQQEPLFQQWVFRQGGQTLVGEAEVTSNGTTTIGDVTYTWSVLTYVVVDVAFQPGRWIFGIGAVLVATSLLGQLIPRQQVWGEISPQGEQVVVRIRERSEGLAYRSKQKWEKALAILRAGIEGT